MLRLQGSDLCDLKPDQCVALRQIIVYPHLTEDREPCPHHYWSQQDPRMPASRQERGLLADTDRASRKGKHAREPAILEWN